MTTLATTDRRRESLAPALLAAVALHIALFAIAVLAGRSSIVPAGTAVPINIVSSAPTTDSREAIQAPKAETAQTETPTPQAKAPAPPPTPAAAPPRPKAPPMKREEPKPAPKAPPVKLEKPRPESKTAPDKAKPKPAPPRQAAPDTFSLDALAADVARVRRPSPPRPAFAARGPTRAETAPVARVDAGQGVSQSDIAGLSQLLERLWNPNCDTAGAEGVIIPVKFSVGDDGRVIGRITEGGRETSPDPAMAAAARRAIDAVHQAEPYGAVYRGKAFTVNFDAKKACATR